jgi:hypothetical protein
MYRIIGADGKEYGPITADQVQQWIKEGRANAQTRVLVEGTTEWKTLGELPEFGGTPPAIAPPGAAPGPAPFPGMVPASRASEMVSAPATGLLIVGILNLLFAAYEIVSTLLSGAKHMTQSTGNPEIDKMMATLTGPMGLLLGGLWLLTGLLQLFGAIKMKRLEGYGLVMAASILGMIPCFSSCCLIGLPIGIWALVVLSKPEVKSAFH